MLWIQECIFCLVTFDICTVKNVNALLYLINID